jgi:pyrroline-5-carboxylate reductase
MTETALKYLRLHLVGCGNMGSALLKSWLNAGVDPSNVNARTRSDESAAALRANFGIRASSSARYEGENVVVLGVKPQMLDAVLANDWHPAPQQPLYLSIAAGKTLDYFSRKLGASARIIRTMPNTPSLVGKGVTTLVAGAHATADDKAAATALCEASGTAVWLENEVQLDVAAAVAGSGPAYVFHFAECLLQAAKELGLPEETAVMLVQGTLGGSCALADAQGWADVAQLRRNVTSKGGVTQAALDVMMPQMPTLVLRALQANITRSKELASE